MTGRSTRPTSPRSRGGGRQFRAFMFVVDGVTIRDGSPGLVIDLADEPGRPSGDSVRDGSVETICRWRPDFQDFSEADAAGVYRGFQ
jgi:hypothetical protein